MNNPGFRMTPVQDLNNLYFFAKVVDFGSYTAAAKALGLQTSKLSRRIAALETELGVRLINRTTRRLSLTEAGKTFHRHCLALLDEAQAAKDAMSQILASPQGLVRISCPTGLLQGGDGEPAELTHSPRLCTDDLFTLRRAALQGIGAVLVPRLLVANDLEGGALIRLLPSLKAHVGIVHAVFPSRRGMVPAVRALLELLSETVRLLPS